MSLEYITLTKSACGDKEAVTLADFPRLKLVSVGGDEIESSAVELLLRHPSLKIWIRAPHTQWMKTLRNQYGDKRIVLENERT